jgi:hypothetical protein
MFFKTYGNKKDNSLYHISPNTKLLKSINVLQKYTEDFSAIQWNQCPQRRIQQTKKRSPPTPVPVLKSSRTSWRANSC